MKKFTIVFFALVALTMLTFAQAPVISVSQTSFSEEVDIGESANVIVTISNIGNRDLNWELSNLKLTFTKESNTNWRIPENQDRINDNVWITRDNSGSLFNAAVEDYSDFWSGMSPAGTKWAAGNTYQPVTTYKSFYGLCSELTSISPWNYNSCYMPIFATDWFEENYGFLSLHLESNNEYRDLDFHSWDIGASGGMGGFSYTRYDFYTWIIPEFLSGKVVPGGSFDLNVNLDSQGLTGGTYNGTLVIVSDDNTNSEVVLEFELIVVGVPDIEVAPISLDFDQKPIGSTSKQDVTISNTGNGVLVISDITSSNSAFDVEETSFSISPGKSKVVEVEFIPQSIEEYIGILQIFNNVDGVSPIEVSLTGEGIEETSVNFSASSFTEELESGTNVVRLLTIGNTGNTQLDFTVIPKPLDDEKVYFSKDDYADWTLYENFDIISPHVALTRQNNQGIFNPFFELSYTDPQSPLNTLWAFGHSGQVDHALYKQWKEAVNGNPSASVGLPMSMYLVEDNMYIDITFLSWTSNDQGGGLSYLRDATAPFVSVSPNIGTLNFEETLDVDVLFDATNLVAGSYQAELVVHTNIPSNPVYLIPVELTVTGNPEVFVQNELNFETVFVNQQTVLELAVYNTGTSILTISNAETDNEHYTVLEFDNTIAPKSKGTILVEFLPITEGVSSAILTISTDDAANPSVSVNLIGEAILPPVIQINQEPISMTVVAGTQEVILFDVYNVGDMDLVGEIYASLSDEVYFSKPSYANILMPEYQDRITDNVWLTRANIRGIFNIKVEENYDWSDWSNQSSPKGTLWAWGSSLENLPENFEYWKEAVSGNPPGMVDNIVTMYSIEDEQYYDFRFHSWVESGQGGGFSYTRVQVPTWIKGADRTFTILAGNDVQKPLTVDATTLIAGQYSANISIKTNDFENELILIPINLTVTGVPEIDVQALLDFGNASVGGTKSKKLTISNVGSEVLEIASITSDTDEFVVTTSALTLNPGQSFDLRVNFSPLLSELYEGILTITSDDPDNGEILVALQGTGVAPPTISISENIIDAWLPPNSLEVITINIENNGDSDLEWYIGGEKITFTKADLADWVLPENQDRITDNVWITRKSTQAIYNIAKESGYSTISPMDTKWSFGSTANLLPADYKTWIQAINSDPQGMVGKDMSLYLETDNLYFDLVFHSYSGGGPGGGFSYTRSEILPEWLSFDQDQGIILPANQQSFDVIVNTDGLDGHYTANFSVFSNDPLQPQLSVAVNLFVADIAVENPLANIRLNQGFGTHDVDISDVFVSLDVNPLSFIVISDNLSVVTAGLSEELITITEVGAGSSLISVRAEDSFGNFLYTDFTFTVNIAPIVANPIADYDEVEGFGVFEIDLQNVFFDFNNDPLSYSAQSDDEAVVTVVVADGKLQISEVGLGNSEITVTASDGLLDVFNVFAFTVSPYLGIPSKSNSNFKIYPNPSAGNISLEFSKSAKGDTTVEVYTIIGQLVFQKSFTESDGRINLDLSRLNSGIYQVRIVDESSVIGNKAIVIQK